MRTWVQRHGLGIVVSLVFLAFTAATLVLGRNQYLSDQAAHGQPDAGFWLWWSFEYAMSLVADVFGIVLLVFLTKRLREIGSAEDKGNS